MARPMTMAEKILAAHAGLDEVVPGQLIECDLDLVLANDITAPIAIQEFKKIGVDSVFDPTKIAITTLPTRTSRAPSRRRPYAISHANRASRTIMR